MGALLSPCVKLPTDARSGRTKILAVAVLGLTYQNIRSSVVSFQFCMRLRIRDKIIPKKRNHVMNPEFLPGK